jgi:hypothetical protein
MSSSQRLSPLAREDRVAWLGVLEPLFVGGLFCRESDNPISTTSAKKLRPKNTHKLTRDERFMLASLAARAESLGATSRNSFMTSVAGEYQTTHRKPLSLQQEFRRTLQHGLAGDRATDGPRGQQFAFFGLNLFRPLIARDISLAATAS